MVDALALREKSMKPTFRNLIAISAALYLGYAVGSHRPGGSPLLRFAAAADEPQVLHFGRDKADFAKGAILVDGSQTNYKVHVSRRDKAGVPEVHSKDTDIFYLRSGKANFVTGGTVKGLKSTAQDEFQGESIDGGKEHPLAAGDVIIIPKGIPHWFRDVPGEVTYFVVKVR
jgi:mannose-6-phosphate isomerase-like protein (cupin superfamily)